MRVAILGGGINGYCCAIQILEHFKSSRKETKEIVDVTIISDAFSPNTTGDGSAGLWGPYLLGGTSLAKVHAWSKSMHDFLQRIWLSEDAGEAGVCLIPCLRLTTNSSIDNVFWKDIVYGATPLTPKELDELSRERAKQFTSGLRFVTFTSEPVKLLPYLMKRFQANGGKVIQQKVQNLREFIANSPYEAIINCTGLGSKQLLQDNEMYAVRGQVARVKANWMYQVVLDESDDGNYIIPNCDSVVLGGTHQVQDYNTVVSAEDKKFIVNGCRRLVPGLEYAQHLYDWVGLRPGRSTLRLAVEEAGNKIVIHNYGHGGSGVTLAWGCADDVLNLLQKEIEKRHVKAKL